MQTWAWTYGLGGLQGMGVEALVRDADECKGKLGDRATHPYTPQPRVVRLFELVSSSNEECVAQAQPGCGDVGMCVNGNISTPLPNLAIWDQGDICWPQQPFSRESWVQVSGSNQSLGSS